MPGCFCLRHSSGLFGQPPLPHSPTGTSTAHGAPDAGDAFSGSPSSPPYAMKPLMVSSFSVTHLAPRDSDTHLPHHCARCSTPLPLISHCRCSSWLASVKDILQRVKYQSDLWIFGKMLSSPKIFFTLLHPNPMDAVGMINLQPGSKASVFQWADKPHVHEVSLGKWHKMLKCLLRRLLGVVTWQLDALSKSCRVLLNTFV